MISTKNTNLNPISKNLSFEFNAMKKKALGFFTLLFTDLNDFIKESFKSVNNRDSHKTPLKNLMHQLYNVLRAHEVNTSTLKTSSLVFSYKLTKAMYNFREDLSVNISLKTDHSFLNTPTL